MTTAPVLPKQRTAFPDVIRGLAISGVLYAYVFWNLGNAPASRYTAFDSFLDAAGSFLLDSKCYTMLAALFAVGFVFHMQKSKDQTAGLFTYRKRLLGLLLLGLVHAFLLRDGDILVDYALMGLLLTLFYTAKTRTIIYTITGLFFLPDVIRSIAQSLQVTLPQRPDTSGMSFLAHNVAYVQYWYSMAPFYWEETLILMLIGLLAGRMLIVQKKNLSNGQLLPWMVAGFVCGTLSYFVIRFYGDTIQRLPQLGYYPVGSTVSRLLWSLHKLGMASGYVMALYMLAQRFQFPLLKNMGRMSLTNYLLQALLLVPICLLFNLFDTFTPTGALLLSTAMWIAQAVYCTWWLRQHRFGPFEWLLRRFTYGTLVRTKEEPAALQPELLTNEAAL